MGKKEERKLEEIAEEQLWTTIGDYARSSYTFYKNHDAMYVTLRNTCDALFSVFPIAEKTYMVTGREYGDKLFFYVISVGAGNLRVLSWEKKIRGLAKDEKSAWVDPPREKLVSGNRLKQ